jgi:hypothetical protein
VSGLIKIDYALSPPGTADGATTSILRWDAGTLLDTRVLFLAVEGASAGVAPCLRWDAGRISGLRVLILTWQVHL